MSDAKHSLEIVGVAKDSRHSGVTGPIGNHFYVPLMQHGASSLANLQVRTAGAPEAMIPEIEHMIGSIAPDLPVFDVKTMTESLDTLNGLLMYELERVSPRRSELWVWCSRLWESTVCFPTPRARRRMKSESEWRWARSG